MASPIPAGVADVNKRILSENAMTTDTLALARHHLLAPAELGDGELQQALARLLDHAIDSGDLYFQSRRAESWSLEEEQG